MYLFIGLGNSGKEYEETRHNAGRLALFAFQKKLDLPDFLENKKFHALISEGKVGKEKVIMALPETMMNNSGKAVGALSAFYKTKPDRVIILHDDSDIVFGNMKMSFAKSSGGHRGVESVKRALKTEKFWRVRIGIQPSAKKHVPAMELVLRKFKPAEQIILKKMFKRINEMLEHLLADGPDRAMNQFN
jgi:PTH1 family peptidyl-tRNA hydrolase